MRSFNDHIISVPVSFDICRYLYLDNIVISVKVNIRHHLTLRSEFMHELLSSLTHLRTLNPPISGSSFPLARRSAGFSPVAILLMFPDGAPAEVSAPRCSLSARTERQDRLKLATLQMLQHPCNSWSFHSASCQKMRQKTPKISSHGGAKLHTGAGN